MRARNLGRFQAGLLIVLAVLFSLGGCDNGTIPGDAVISISAVPGITAPTLGGTPVTTITETDEYTGTVTWDGSWDWSPYFGGGKAYTATITLAIKSGYTLSGVAEDFFTVPGADTVVTDAVTGVIEAVFPATESVSIGDEVCGGKVGYILKSGDDGYVEGEQRGLIVTPENLGDGRIIWAMPSYQSTGVPGGTDSALGAGSVNTDNIIAQNDPDGEGLVTYAAGLARAHSGGGYSDWFLPSLDELMVFFDNNNELGFDPETYWSSSERPDRDNYARSCDVSDGSSYTGLKSGEDPVRATRYF